MSLWANHPPNPPSPPSGRCVGYPGISYNYSTSTEDPDSDPVCYEFDWNDDAQTITEPYPSGSAASESKAWDSPLLSYQVRVRAHDYAHELCSSWSSISPVTIYGMGDIEHEGMVDIYDMVARYC